jgi:hypothetical protein
MAYRTGSFASRSGWKLSKTYATTWIKRCKRRLHKPGDGIAALALNCAKSAGFADFSCSSV